jgi:predicted ArsR family transcriptional regulator
VLWAIWNYGDREVLGMIPFRHGLTDDEIANKARLVSNSVRPRRGELVRDGLVQDSGHRRSSNMGHPAVVWTLTEEGLRAAKELTDG